MTRSEIETRHGKHSSGESTSSYKTTGQGDGLSKSFYHRYLPPCFAVQADPGGGVDNKVLLLRIE